MQIHPSRASPPSPVRWTAWLKAVRPGFLVLTVIACGVGFATSAVDGLPLQAGYALATVVLAALTHAAVNVYNDCGDAVIGTDAINDARVEPFTGGSRVIQNGELDLGEMYRLAGVLALVATVGGLMLAAQRGPGLIAIAALGALVGWAYSQPALALMSRGLGEFAVALGWALVVVGADYVQRGAFAWLPLLASTSLALLVAAVLLINQIPDIAADAACGKRTLAVRGGASSAMRVYGLLSLAAYGWVVLAVLRDWLPAGALWALGALPFGLLAWATGSARTARALPLQRVSLQASVMQAMSHGALLIAGLGWQSG